MTTPGGFSRAGLIMVAIFGAILIWLAIDLLLLVFAGILLAIFLRTLALGISDRTPLSTGWALLVVILTLLGITVGATALFAPRLGEEARELTETLPQALEELEEQVRQNAFGDWVLDRLIEEATKQESGQGPQAQGQEAEKQSGQTAQSAGAGKPGAAGAGGGEEEEKPALKDAQDAVVSQATGAAGRVMDALVAFVILLFTGLYLAAHPQPYIRGLLRLFPLHRRERIGEVLYACGYTLRWWLFGQLLAMAVVGTLMGVGLAFIGVPLAFALGVVAGLFEFIPTLGPLLGLAPAVLLALTQDTTAVMWVLGLYTVVQTFEAYLLTPLVQQRVVHLPPVVTIVAQVFFAWTVGPLGLLIAVPLVAVLMVVVQMLYVEDFLGDDMKVDAADQGRIEHAKAEPLKDDEEADGE